MTLLERISERLVGTEIVLTKIPYSTSDGFVYSVQPHKNFESYLAIIEGVYRDRWEPESDWELMVRIKGETESKRVFVGLNEEILIL